MDDAPCAEGADVYLGLAQNKTKSTGTPWHRILQLLRQGPGIEAIVAFVGRRYREGSVKEVQPASEKFP